MAERFDYDNLIASDRIPVSGGTVTVASGEGALKKGSILMRNSSNKFVLANESETPGTPLGSAEVILAADVDATSADAVAEVFLTGEFFENFLTVAADYTLTEADKVALKNAGVYLVSGLTNV